MWCSTGIKPSSSSGARRAAQFDQLVGPYSREGFHHPGPAVFYLLSPFVRFLEPTGPGLYLGAIVISGAALAATVAFVWRRLGPLAALWAAVAIDLYCLCLGVGTLREPWNPYLIVAPMVLFVVLWAAAVTRTAGSTDAAIWALVIGSYEIQTHIATGAAVVVMSAIMVVWLAGRCVARPSERRETAMAMGPGPNRRPRRLRAGVAASGRRSGPQPPQQPAADVGLLHVRPFRGTPAPGAPDRRRRA